MLSILILIIISFQLSFNSRGAQAIYQNRSISSRACPCYNQGICDSSTSLCICPSGYVGQQCERLDSTTLCNNVVCKNSGVCNIISPIESICWCLLGFHGEYCQRQTAASRCTQIQCQNGGFCYEHSPAISVFAYCVCPPGFTGRFCEIQYFQCSTVGTFLDLYNCAQGFYFVCDNSNKLIQAQCPKGLRFNLNKMSCDHCSAVPCPVI